MNNYQELASEIELLRQEVIGLKESVYTLLDLVFEFDSEHESGECEIDKLPKHMQDKDIYDNEYNFPGEFHRLLAHQFPPAPALRQPHGLPCPTRFRHPHPCIGRNHPRLVWDFWKQCLLPGTNPALARIPAWDKLLL